MMDHHPPAGAIAWPYTDEAILGTLPVAVPAARRFVAEMLAKWGLSDYLIESAAIIASELATNAVKASWPDHATQPVKLWLMANEHNVVIEVWDASPDMPQERPSSDDAESGRGLVIVGALCASWGVYATTAGKTVWALLSE